MTKKSDPWHANGVSLESSSDVGNLTKEQKAVLVDLATRFWPEASSIMIRNDDETVMPINDPECARLKSMQEGIVAKTGLEYPDDEDLHEDAVLAVSLLDRIISQCSRKRPNGND